MHRLASLLLLAALPARAYRPFDGTDAAVVQRGELEIELGPAGLLREAGRRFLVAPALVANLGILDRTELVLEARHHLLLGASGGEARERLVDTALNVKSVLREGELQGASGTSVALEIGLLLPTWHGDPGVGAIGAVIVSRKAAGATLHLNGAASLTRRQRIELFASAILEGPDAWPVRPVGEVFVQPELGGDTGVSGLVGAIWRASAALSFDAGVRLAREAGDSVLELRAGLTFTLDLFG